MDETDVADTASSTAKLRDAPRKGAESFVVEESGPHAAPDLRRPRPHRRYRRDQAPEDTMSSESAVNLDQGDPLAEADFHMAYGLYDQAADLVRIALEREPDRRDLRLKLLEIYFVWGNKDAFLQTAKSLEATRDRARRASGTRSSSWASRFAPTRRCSPRAPAAAAARAHWST